jgi:hypothetical protein
MMNRTLFLLAGMITILLTQCITSSINIALPASERRPILLGLMHSGDSVDVFVSQTAPARGQASSDVYVDDAQVQVLANGQVIAGRGRYVGRGLYRLQRQQALQAGTAYQLKAISPILGTLTSKPDTLPQAVAVTAFVSQGSSCTLTFTDPPGRQHYVVDVELYQNNERIFQVPNLALLRAFSDELFEGQSHSIIFSLTDWGTRYTSAGGEQVVRANQARVRLLSISQQTHQYFSSVNEYELSTGAPEIEPTAPLSGVPGGLGYFGTGNSQTFYEHRFR